MHQSIDFGEYARENSQMNIITRQTNYILTKTSTYTTWYILVLGKKFESAGNLVMSMKL